MTLQAAQCNRGSPVAALFAREGATPKCPVHGESCEEFHRLKEKAEQAEALRAALERLRGDAMLLLHRQPVRCFDETIAEVDAALAK